MVSETPLVKALTEQLEEYKEEVVDLKRLIDKKGKLIAELEERGD